MKATALAVLTLASAPSFAVAPLSSVGITAGVAVNCEEVAKGQTFFSATFNFYYDGYSKIVFSSQPDGTGATSADDKVIIMITHPDGSVGKFKYDYLLPDNNNPLPPKELCKKFQPGVNQVTVTLSDTQGGCVWASPMWLTTQPGDHGPY